MEEEKRCDSQLILGARGTEEHQEGRSWDDSKFPNLEHLKGDAISQEKRKRRSLG